MKKSLFSLILALTALFTSGATASADEPVYSRILAEDIVIYMDASLTMPWFVLPYSYYVKVLSSDARSVKVEYKGGDPLRPAVKGYIRASDLSVTDETPAAPYPNSSFTVGQSCLLYKDANFLYFETVTENSTFDFYGYITRPGDEIYLFGYTVTASGDKYIGFIPKTALLNFAMPALAVIEPSSEPPEPLPETTESVERVSDGLGDNLQVVIVLGISVVAISIVYLLFRPSPEKAKEEAVSRRDFNDE